MYKKDNNREGRGSIRLDRLTKNRNISVTTDDPFHYLLNVNQVYQLTADFAPRRCIWDGIQATSTL
jgi:hypothetical protein